MHLDWSPALSEWPGAGARGCGCCWCRGAVAAAAGHTKGSGGLALTPWRPSPTRRFAPPFWCAYLQLAAGSSSRTPTQQTRAAVARALACELSNSQFATAGHSHPSPPVTLPTRFLPLLHLRLPASERAGLPPQPLPNAHEPLGAPLSHQPINCLGAFCPQPALPPRLLLPGSDPSARCLF